MSNRREELERAVLAAAIEANGVGRPPSTAQQTVLRQAVHALIFDCPECNAGGHTCPGCGASVAHYGPRACRDCDEHAHIEPQDPITGDFIPATQDAELERMGREMVAGVVVHWGNDDRTACGKWSGLVYAYVDDRRKVTCGACLEAGNNQPQWTPRTMADVRRGDRIRPTGSTDPAHEMDVADRYWPPAPDGSDRDTWHVTAGKWHGEDHVVQDGECCVVLGADPRPRFFDPAMKVDIRVTAGEVAAIEALGGWSARR